MGKPHEKNLQKAVVSWFFALVYMGIIFYFSSIKATSFPRVFRDFDKVVHIGIYAVLAFLLYLAFKNSGVRKYIFLLSTVVAAVYGITDELHQFYVPFRVFSLGDLIADCFGAILGSCLAGIANHK